MDSDTFSEASTAFSLSANTKLSLMHKWFSSTALRWNELVTGGKVFTQTILAKSETGWPKLDSRSVICVYSQLNYVIKSVIMTEWATILLIICK